MQFINSKTLIVFLFTITTQLLSAQKDERISTVDFVQILDGNRAEAIYY